MKKPKIKIEHQPLDKAIELIGLLGLILLIALPLFFYNKLPDTVPSHFGANGKPDGFSGKGIIWLLPIVGIILYAGMHWLSKYPHTFNYTQKITKENAERQYTVASRMMRTLNTIIAWVFTYLTYSSIQIATGNQTGLGAGFMPIFLILIFGTVGYFLFKSMSKKSETK